MDDIKLELLRKEKNLTQDELAQAIGVSRQYYNQIENGKKKPSVELAKRLSDMFGINWTIFFN